MTIFRNGNVGYPQKVVSTFGAMTFSIMAFHKIDFSLWHPYSKYGHKKVKDRLRESDEEAERGSHRGRERGKEGKKREREAKSERRERERQRVKEERERKRQRVKEERERERQREKNGKRERKKKEIKKQ
jgi:hypothetical protein